MKLSTLARSNEESKLLTFHSKTLFSLHIKFLKEQIKSLQNDLQHDMKLGYVVGKSLRLKFCYKFGTKKKKQKKYLNILYA